MKLQSPHAPSFAVVGFALVAATIAVLPAGAAGPTMRRTFAVPQRPMRVEGIRRPLLRPFSNIASPTPCTTQYSASGTYSFVGFTNGGDVAGGDDSAVLGGNSNAACDPSTGVGTGLFNTVGSGGTAYYSFIGGGEFNGVTGSQSFIGGGSRGEISGNGSFIGSGGYAVSGMGDVSAPVNVVAGSDSFVGAGDLNSVAGNEAFVGSGQSNAIASAATYSAILGGAKNEASSPYATVMGGYGNTASGEYATVLGGNTTTAAGELSLAAGYHADATHNGSFVWSDFSSGSMPVKDTAVNQFVVRASGGTEIYSNEGMTSGVRLNAGSGVWSSLSDRNAKTGVVALDDDAVLDKVAALPVTSWRYASESGVRHVGPMAQDFYAAFGVGEDDRHITSIDEDGVALAAIKALHRENTRLRADVARLRAVRAAKDASFEMRLRALEARASR